MVAVTPFTGFDYRLDVGAPLIREKLMEGLVLGGQPVVPGAEFYRRLRLGFGVAELHSLVRTVDVTIGTPEGGQVIEAIVHLSEASVTVGQTTVCPLEVDLQVTIPVGLGGDGLQQQVEVRLDRATTSATLDQESSQRVTQSLPGVDPMQFLSYVEAEVTRDVRARGAVELGNSFELSPGERGSLDPLIFSRAAVRCVWSTHAEEQAVVLLGMLLPEHDVDADPGKVRYSNLRGGETLALMVQTDVMRELYICPFLEEKLVAPEGSCGVGARIQLQDDIPPAEITGVKIDIWTEGISIYVRAQLDHWAGSVSVLMLVSIRPRIDDEGRLLFESHVGKPRVDISPAPGYALALAALTAPFSTIVLSEVAGRLKELEGVLSEKVQTEVKKLVPAALPIPGFDQLPWKRLRMSNTWLLLWGAPPIMEPTRVAPAVVPKREEVELRRDTVGSGFEPVPACGPDARAPWSEQLIWVQLALSLSVTAYSRPIYATWELIDDTGHRVALTGTQGVAELTEVTSAQSATGIMLTERMVSVKWQLHSNGLALYLWNDPADGNYSFRVFGRVTNCAGTLDWSMDTYIEVWGHIINTLADAKALECLRNLMRRWQVIDVPEIPTPWREIDPRPTLMDIARLQLRLVADEDPEVRRLGEIVGRLTTVDPLRLRLQGRSFIEGATDFNE
jgi:hypothetical protein